MDSDSITVLCLAYAALGYSYGAPSGKTHSIVAKGGHESVARREEAAKTQSAATTTPYGYAITPKSH